MEVDHNQSVDVEQIDMDDIEVTNDGYVANIDDDSIEGEIIITLTDEEIEQIAETNQFAVEDPTTDFGMLLFVPNHREIESSEGPGITATSSFARTEVNRLRNDETIVYRSSHVGADLYEQGPTIKVTVE